MATSAERIRESEAAGAAAAAKVADKQAVKERKKLVRKRTKIVDAIYYDKKVGYGSVAQTAKLVKKVDPTITYEFVRNRILGSGYRQTHYTPNKQNSYISMGPKHELEVDIMDFTKEAEEAHEVAEKVRYGLVGLDNFTKKAAVIPIRKRNAEAVSDGMVALMDKLGIPKQIYTDQEGSFMGKEFKVICEVNDITHIPTTGKAQGAERLIRTLKDHIFKRLNGGAVKGWVDVVDDVVNKYNRQPHHTIGLSPNQATQPANEMFVRYNLFDKAKTNRKWPPLSVGDKVRIKLIKKNTAKGYDPKFSEAVFKVLKEEDGVYTLNVHPDSKQRATYRRFELLKVNF